MWGYFGWGRYNAVTVLFSLSAAPSPRDPRPPERPASRLLRSAWVGHGPSRYVENLGRYDTVTFLPSLVAAPSPPDPRPPERPASRLLRSAWVGHGPSRYEEVLGGFMILLLSYLVVMQRLVLLILDRQRDPLEDY